MLMALGCGYANNMPRRSGSERTNISPCAWRCGVSASHTLKTSLTCLPSLISRLALGSASCSSIGTICACATPSQVSASTHHNARLVGCMAVIVAEFDPACKIEAGQHHAFLARQAGRRPDAEAAGHHAVHGRARPEGFDAFLLQRVHRALVVALGREHAAFAFEQHRHVGAQRSAATAFADAGDAEYQADAVRVTAQRAADAHAHAIALVVLSRRTRPAR